jgi:hypothetical protein
MGMKALAAVAAFVGVTVATSGPKYATPLQIVVGLLIFVEPLWRIDWRRHAHKTAKVSSTATSGADVRP